MLHDSSLRTDMDGWHDCHGCHGWHGCHGCHECHGFMDGIAWQPMHTNVWIEIFSVGVVMTATLVETECFWWKLEHGSEETLAPPTQLSENDHMLGPVTYVCVAAHLGAFLVLKSGVVHHVYSSPYTVHRGAVMRYSLDETWRGWRTEKAGHTPALGY